MADPLPYSSDQIGQLPSAGDPVLQANYYFRIIKALLDPTSDVYDERYARLGTANTFVGNQTIQGSMIMDLGAAGTVSFIGGIYPHLAFFDSSDELQAQFIVHMDDAAEFYFDADQSIFRSVIDDQSSTFFSLDGLRTNAILGPTGGAHADALAFFGGGGQGVFAILDCIEEPTAAIDGVILFSDGGALKCKAGSGTVTTLAT